MSEDIYQIFFEKLPVPLVKEDLTDVKAIFDDLHRCGITDVGKYIEIHPEILKRCISMIRADDSNKAACDLYEAEEKEELLENFPRIFCEETYDALKEKLKAIYSGKTFFQTKSVKQTLRGRKIRVLIRGTLMPDHDEKSLKALVAMLDITRKRWGQADQELLETRALLESVFNSIPEPMVVVDKDMTVKQANAAALKCLQSPCNQEIFGRPCFESLRNRPSPCEGCEIPAHMAKGRNVTFKRQGILNPDTLEQVTISFLDGNEDSKGLALIRVSDITEETRMEQELVQADKMISVGILVSEMAHEINNPTNSIMLNTPILREVWENILPIIDRYYEEKGDFAVGGLSYSEVRNEVPELFSGIEKGAKRIKNIVQDLKDYSRGESSKTYGEVNINEIVRLGISLTSNIIKRSTRHFSVQYGDDLPLIRGNMQGLEQIIINLIENACQALPDREKGIRVSTSCDDESGHIVVIVEDEGRGIPDEVLPRIMDPFFTTRRGEGGTGLGLAVSGKIVREHGGLIDVKSEPGKGSTFRIFLPTAEKKRLTTILVADDDDEAREMLSTILKAKHYVVEEACNGTEACVKLGRDRPDLLILDIHMPNMDGVEVCRVIKQTKELSGIKVIVVTGFSGSPKVKEVEDMGFEDILYKPVRIPALLKAVKSVLKEDQPGPRKLQNNAMC